ncbi:MAG: lysine biosynthesis protein LysW [Thaumarchaeota archaeon]|nr:lysine biosynthesis protein LysW [Nitrososphaerota archaeon]
MDAECPECGAKFTLPEDVVQGEIVTCPDCGVDLEVVGVKGGKVELKVAEAVGEDWGE